MKVYILAKCRNEWQNGRLIYEEAVRQQKDVALGCLEWSFERIYADIAAKRPDWVFITGPRTVNASCMKRLKRLANVVLWDADGISPYTLRYWDMLKGIPNLIISQSLGKAERLQTHSRNITFLPQFFDSTFCRVTDHTNRREGAVFIGSDSNSPKRREWLQRAECELGVKLYGRIKGSTPNEIYGSDMANVYASAKMSFDIQREYVTPMTCGTSDRMFKAMGCGALYITYPIEDIDRLFVPGVHFVQYDGTYKGLADAIDFWGGYDYGRNDIASAGQQEVLAKHTLKVRLNEYWDVMEKAV